jgi:hypothetical protein
VATAVIGERSPCFLIVQIFDDSPVVVCQALAGLEHIEMPEWENQRLAHLLVEDEDISTSRFIAFEVSWESETWDDLITEVANDRAGSILFFSRAGNIYAPYDGGADLFCPDSATYIAHRRAFWSWMSTRPDGL